MKKYIFDNDNGQAIEYYLATDVENKLHSPAQNIISELQDKLHHRNMQIKELKKQLVNSPDKFKDLVMQILNMTNIHGTYKDDTDCVNSIREAIYTNISR